MQILVKIEDQEVRDLLYRLRERVSDMRPVMATIGETIKRSIQKNFDEGGRPAKWPASNRVKSEGGETLKLTGILKNSITVDSVEPLSVSVGTADQRARTHHFGAGKGSFGTFVAKVKSHPRMVTQAFGKPLLQPVTAMVQAHNRTVKLPWGDIPARPFMMIQDEDWRSITEQLKKYLENVELGGSA